MIDDVKMRQEAAEKLREAAEELEKSDSKIIGVTIQKPEITGNVVEWGFIFTEAKEN